MTLFEITREAAREAVQMYFEPISSLFGRFKDHGHGQPLLVEETHLPEPSGQPESSDQRASYDQSESFDSLVTYKRRKALVVEDDAATRHALVDLVAANGIDVDWAADGETAVTYLSCQSYDVLILDIVLPRTWMAIMEHLACVQRRMLASTIVVTGDDVSEVRRLFPDFADVLARPVIPSQLLRAVQMCIVPSGEELNSSSKLTA